MIHNLEMEEHSDGHFSIKVGNRLNWMDSFPMKVIPGTKSTIRVVPILQESKGEVQEVDISTRRCRYEGEVKEGAESVFKGYSKENCLLECAIWKTQLHFDCVPWNLKLLSTIGGENLCSGKKVK